MNTEIKRDQWVWVVVQDPGEQEQFVGQYDEGMDESFIPLFLEKEEAQFGLNVLSREKGHKYEVQAILYEDLAGIASDKGFRIFVLNGEGEILDKIESFK
ncbi:MAG: hypothetical protein V2J25_01340 [Desulfatiglans sp.]|jgi:hypothetical protein|nr:hypothetical protein [Desulfatiglans sp.]